MAFELYNPSIANARLWNSGALYLSLKLFKSPPWQNAAYIEVYIDRERKQIAVRPLPEPSGDHCLRIATKRNNLRYVYLNQIIEALGRPFRAPCSFSLEPLTLEDGTPVYVLKPIEEVNHRG